MNEFTQSIDILKTHFKSIVVGCVIGAIIAFLIMIFQKPVYQAEMIIAPTERTGVPSLSSFLPKAAADAPALQYFVERIDVIEPAHLIEKPIAPNGMILFPIFIVLSGFLGLVLGGLRKR